MTSKPGSGPHRRPSVLVTGSEGLIGSQLCERLLKDGFNVLRFDIRTGQNVLDMAALLQNVRLADGVVHLAAVSRVVEAYRDPLRAVLVNVLGTAHLLEAARTSDPRPWIIFGSSREVYGEPRKIPVSESLTPRPVNVYGATKLSGESLIQTSSANYGLRSITVRFSNVYGGPNDHETRVVPAFVRSALLGQDLVVNGGNQTFDFVHLNDAVDGVMSAIDLISRNSGRQHWVFHLVSGRGTSINELAKKILKITESKSAIRFDRARTYDVVRFVGDPSKARRELRWRARINLEKGLRLYVHLMAQRFRSRRSR